MNSRLRVPPATTLEIVIANAAFGAALFPFVSPVPVAGRDVQMFALFAALLACAAAIRAGRTHVFADRQSCILLVAGWVYLLYVRWDVMQLDAFWLQRCAAILISLPVYWAMRAWYDTLDYRVVAGSVAVYLLVAVLQLNAPAVVNGMLLHVLGGLRFSLDAGRGATSLTPEPSGLAAVTALCLWLPRVLPGSIARAPRYLPVVAAVACVVLIVLSGSLMGLVLLTGMGVVELLALVRRSTLRRTLLPAALFSGALVAFSLYAARSQSEQRAVSAVRTALLEPAAFLRDPSLQARLAGTMLSIETLALHPLGTREVNVDFDIADRGFSSPFFASLADEPELLGWLHDFVQVYGFTELGRGIQRLGIFYFGLLMVLFGPLRGLGALQLWLLAVLTQNSLYLSSIWLLLGLGAARRQSAPAAPSTA